jgi:hypothetical protein
MMERIVIATPDLIRGKQSGAPLAALDCFVAALLAMTGKPGPSSSE